MACSLLAAPQLAHGLDWKMQHLRCSPYTLHVLLAVTSCHCFAVQVLVHSKL
jgi:hypothetical protein